MHGRLFFLKRKFTETEKNYLICAVLMIVSGIGLIIMGKNAFGIGCMAIGVIFAVVSIVMYIKGYDLDEEAEKRKKNEKNGKSHEN